jgi:serine/threonine-protein kinase
MNPSLSRRAFALLRDALEHDVSERDAFVTAQCGDDGALAQAVRELLAAAAGTHRLLDRDVADVAVELSGQADDDDLPPGAMLGPWRVLRQIGRGGMGSVWLGERAGDDYVQRCALKLIRRGMDSRDVLARFRRERGILARLAHPNIARLVDGGVADDGRPWFAMEYVEGVPLDAWSARADVDRDARIALVLRLADALSYAHRQLVVHRDLKPSNVIVDARGEPHLLDFGIARLVDDDAADRTATAARFLTRAYAAPEQVRGEDAGTATDVWQLGVLLHELLAGARFGDAASRPLRGDAGVIVARATDADPARRYASVDALAADLVRWRDGRAILARGDSAGYRVRRFLARHKLGVAAAVFALAALVGGAALALWQARIANGEARRAEAVNGFLEDIFSSIDPANARGRELTAKDLVDAAATRIDRELADQPAAAAQLRGVLGASYVGLGDYASARAQFEAALPLFSREQDALAIDTRHSLAQILEIIGDYDGALALVDAAEALRVARRPDDADLRDTLILERAAIASAKGDPAAAVALSRPALASRRERLGPDAPATLSAEQSISTHLYDMGELEEATALIRHVVDVERATLSPDDPKRGSALFNLSTYQSEVGDHAAALVTADEALALRQKVLPANHADIARTLGRKAMSLERVGRAPEALALRPQIVAILRAQAEPDKGLLAQELNNWGVTCHRVGDMNCAVERITEALALWQTMLASDHPHLLTARSNLAALETARGRLADGEAQLRLVIAARDAATARDGDNLQSAGGWLASQSALISNLRFQGRAAEALAPARAELARAERFYPPPSVEVSTARGDIAAVLADTGDCAQAEPIAQTALDEARTLAPAGALEGAHVSLVLGDCALARGDAAAAATHYRDAVAGYTTSGGAEHWRTLLARGSLGLALAAGGDHAAARTELDAAIGALTTQRPWLRDLAPMRAARAKLPH